MRRPTCSQSCSTRAPQPTIVHPCFVSESQDIAVITSEIVVWAGVGSDQFDGLNGKKDCRVGPAGCSRDHNKYVKLKGSTASLNYNRQVLGRKTGGPPFFLQFPSPCFSLPNTDNTIRGAPMPFPLCQTLTLDKMQRHHRWVHLRFTAHARDDSTEFLLLLLHLPVSRTRFSQQCTSKAR